MSKENSRERRIELMLAHNQHIQTLYVTADDQGFEKESSAEAHTNRLVDKTIEAVKNPHYKKPVVNLPGTSGTAPTDTPAPEADETNILDNSIGDLKKALQDVTDIEALEALKSEEEAAEKPRKGALDAIDARIAEIQTAAANGLDVDEEEE